MSLHHGSKIVTNGLVFAYDMGPNPGVNKSWKGKPTTNLLTNGHFANNQHVTQYTAAGSYGSYSIEYFPANPGHSYYVLRQNGGTNGEYEMGPTLSASTTYCVSCWVAYSPDSDLNTQILHTRWYYPGGNSTTGGAGTLAETKVMGGLTWERRYVTFTTSADATGAFQWYLGYSTGGTTGFRYLTDLQIEVGSYPSPFVNGTRSNTTALLDWTGNNTITATSLTYNTDGTFSFNGSTDYLQISQPNISTSPNRWTISGWINPASSGHIVVPNSNGIDNILSYSTSNGGELVLTVCEVADVNGRSFRTGSSTMPLNQWTHFSVSIDNLTVTMYTNGVLRYSGVETIAMSNWTGTWRVGQRGNSTNYLNGSIENLQVYNRALTANEVAQNFEALRGRYGL